MSQAHLEKSRWSPQDWRGKEKQRWEEAESEGEVVGKQDTHTSTHTHSLQQ